MGNNKPENIEKYKEWLKEEHNIEISDVIKSNYTSVTTKVKRDFEKSKFWIELLQNMNMYDQEYLSNCDYPLFIPNLQPKLYVKPFSSFLEKTFRRNILENTNWDESPKDGWYFPENWYSKIHDIVRTCFVVKYLDGVEFLQNKIDILCDKYSQKLESCYEARWEGYYALHLNIIQNYEIPKPELGTKKIDIPVEIQITTQVQDVILKLLHKYYEERRKKVKIEEFKWQWDYQSEEFAANYLGHILHYIEGMIMEVREKQKGKLL